ncbi:hypothetical protein VCHE25_0643 [Vibrio cholerae HE-25]|uniref:Uncharacterized protein n=1 Tax=Vibrio cholerae (strain MO10) TaxID=345072 RepID=A0A0X1L0Y3_VIBCO|nr:predicted protein [Vibrio cholerae MO10]EJH66688.1 hypothetical protein VCHE25_0643 [Vibrio cholerae HE-25]EKM06213.1 hypothetical protein VCHC55B2_3646 [Vibrio cholerae HC-55B2]
MALHNRHNTPQREAQFATPSQTNRFNRVIFCNLAKMNNTYLCYLA